MCSCTEVLSDMYLNAAGHGWKRSERADVTESCTGFKRMQSGDVQQLAVAELLYQICQRKLIWKNQHEKHVSHSLFVRHLWHPVHVWEQIQKNNGQWNFSFSVMMTFFLNTHPWWVKAWSCHKVSMHRTIVFIQGSVCNPTLLCRNTELLSKTSEYNKLTDGHQNVSESYLWSAG